MTRVPPPDRPAEIVAWTESVLGASPDAGFPRVRTAERALVAWSAGAVLPLLVIGERALPNLLVDADAHSGWDRSQLDFATSGEFFLWICLLSSYTGIGVAALFWLAPEARRLGGAVGRRTVLATTGGLGLALLVAGVLPFAFLGDRERQPVPGFDMKVMFLWLVALLPSAVAMVCACLVGEISRLQQPHEIEKDPAASARAFLTARRQVTAYLAVAGGAVALLVLSVGAMRMALEDSGFEVAWDEEAQLGPAFSALPCWP